MCRIGFILLALSLGAAATARAQSNVVLSGPAACRECQIELEQVVSFGDATGPGMLHEQSIVTTDRRGRFYVTSTYDPTIAVFDPRGRFISRIGRRGNGPGEFGFRPAMVIGAGDTLFAFDFLQSRMSVFAPDYSLVRTRSLPRAGSTAVQTPDGGFLLSGPSLSADGIGYPLHITDRNGAYVRSFGSETGEQHLNARRDATLRRIAAPRGAGVWISRINPYVLEQWSLEGKRLSRLTREVDWFPPDVPVVRSARPGRNPPRPQVASIVQDSAGLLWTLSLVPDKEWKPHTLPALPSAPGATYVPDSLRHKLSDTVLEVIDPARGSVLVTRTFDAWFMGFIAPGMLVSFTEDADGNPRYVVWRAKVVSLTK